MRYNTVPGGAMATNNTEKVDFLIGVTNMAWPGIAAVQSGFANLTAAGMRTTGKLNEDMSKTQAGMMALGGGAALAMGIMISEAAKFQKEMALAQSLMESVTNTQIAQMNAAAKQLAVTFGELPTEVASGFQRLGRAGVGEMNDQITVLTNSIRLAKIEGLGIEQATTILISTINTFGDTYQNAEKYANTLAHAANLSIATVKDLADSMKYFGSVAREHWSIEQTTAAISTLASKGIVGQLAGTSLRSFTNYLIREMPKSQKALNQLGLTFDEFWEHAGGHRTKLKPLEDIIKMMYDASKARGMSRGELTKVLAQFGEPRMMQQYLKLFPTDEEMEAGTWVFDKFNKKMTEGYDIATRYNTVMRTASAQFDQFKSAMVVLAISIGEVVLPVFSILIGMLRDFANFVAQNQVLTTALAVALTGAAAAGAYFVLTWGWGLIASAWTEMTKSLGNAIFNLANILGIETAAVDANTAAYASNLTIRQSLATFIPEIGAAESIAYPQRNPIAWASGRADKMSRTKGAGQAYGGMSYYGEESAINDVYMADWLAKDLQKMYKSPAYARPPIPHEEWETNVREYLDQSIPQAPGGFTDLRREGGQYMGVPIEGGNRRGYAMKGKFEPDEAYRQKLVEDLSKKAEGHQKTIIDYERRIKQARARNAPEKEIEELQKVIERQSMHLDNTKDLILDSSALTGISMAASDTSWKGRLKGLRGRAKEGYKNPRGGTLMSALFGEEEADTLMGTDIRRRRVGGAFGEGGRFGKIRTGKEAYSFNIGGEPVFAKDRYEKGYLKATKDLSGQYRPKMEGEHVNVESGRYTGATRVENVGGRFVTAEDKLRMTPISEVTGSKVTTLAMTLAPLAGFIPEAIAGLPVIAVALAAIAVPLIAMITFFQHLGKQIDDNKKKIQEFQKQSESLEKTSDALEKRLAKTSKWHPISYLKTLNELTQANAKLDQVYEKTARANREIYNAKAWQPQNFPEFRKEQGPSWYGGLLKQANMVLNPTQWGTGQGLTSLLNLEQPNLHNRWMSGPQEQMFSAAYGVEKERRDKTFALTDNHERQLAALEEQHKKGRFKSDAEYQKNKTMLDEKFNQKKTELDKKYDRQTAQIVGPKNVDSTKRMYEVEERLKIARMEAVNAVMRMMGVIFQIITLPLTLITGQAFHASADKAKGKTEDLNSRIKNMSKEMEAAAKRIEGFAQAVQNFTDPIAYWIYRLSHMISVISAVLDNIFHPDHILTKQPINPFPESFDEWKKKNEEGKEHYNPAEREDNAAKKFFDWITGNAEKDVYKRESAEETKRITEAAKAQHMTAKEYREKYISPSEEKKESSTDQLQKKKESEAAQAQVPPAGVAGAGVAGAGAKSKYSLHSPFKINEGTSGDLGGEGGGGIRSLIFPDLDPKKFKDLAVDTAKGLGNKSINVVTGISERSPINAMTGFLKNISSNTALPFEGLKDALFGAKEEFRNINMGRPDEVEVTKIRQGGLLGKGGFAEEIGLPMKDIKTSLKDKLYGKETPLRNINMGSPEKSVMGTTREGGLLQELRTGSRSISRMGMQFLQNIGTRAGAFGEAAGLLGEGGLLTGIGGGIETGLAAFGLADIWNPLGWVALGLTGIMALQSMLGGGGHYQNHRKGNTFGLHSPFKINAGTTGELDGANTLVFPDLDPKRFKNLAQDTATNLTTGGNNVVSQALKSLQNVVNQNTSPTTATASLIIEQLIIQTKDDPDAIYQGLITAIVDLERRLNGGA